MESNICEKKQLSFPCTISITGRLLSAIATAFLTSSNQLQEKKRQSRRASVRAQYSHTIPHPIQMLGSKPGSKVEARVQLSKPHPLKSMASRRRGKRLSSLTMMGVDDSSSDESDNEESISYRLRSNHLLNQYLATPMKPFTPIIASENAAIAPIVVASLEKKSEPPERTNLLGEEAPTVEDFEEAPFFNPAMCVPPVIEAEYSSLKCVQSNLLS